MAALILPSRFAQQPQGAVGIDNGNPLTQGLVCAVLPFNNGFFDVVSGQFLTYSGAGTTSSAIAKEGRMIRLTAASSQFFSLPIKIATSDNVTLGCVASPNSTTTQYTAVSVGNATGGNTYRANIGSGLSGVAGWYVGAKWGGGTTYSQSGATATSVFRPDRVLLRHSLASRDIWLNGVKDGTQSTVATSISTSLLQNFYVSGFYNAPQTSFFDGWVGLGCFWNRYLSDSEAAAFGQNPWQMFKAPQRRIWVSVPATGNTGAITWTEAADTLSASGSVSVTGAASWAEASDTASLTGTATVSGSASWTEASDTAALAGTVTLSGSVAWTEENDSASLTGTATVSGSISWTEAADTAIISGAATVSIAGSWTEDADTAALSGSVGSSLSCNIAWTEANDSAAISSTIRVNASGSWAEDSDTTGSAASVLVGITIGWTENSDSVAMFSTVQSGNTPLPTMRILKIDAENRTFSTRAENRALAISPENRTLLS